MWSPPSLDGPLALHRLRIFVSLKKNSKEDANVRNNQSNNKNSENAYNKNNKINKNNKTKRDNKNNTKNEGTKRRRRKRKKKRKKWCEPKQKTTKQGYGETQIPTPALPP